jgi:hypothetical protein
VSRIEMARHFPPSTTAFVDRHKGATMSLRITKRRRIGGGSGARPPRADAARHAATLISILVATAAAAGDPSDGGSTGARGPGEGVMRQLLSWQTCFKRDGTHDIAVILDACDRLAESPDLLPNQREFLARWRAKLSNGDPTGGRTTPSSDTTSATRP